MRPSTSISGQVVVAMALASMLVVAGCPDDGDSRGGQRNLDSSPGADAGDLLPVEDGADTPSPDDAVAPDDGPAPDDTGLPDMLDEPETGPDVVEEEVQVQLVELGEVVPEGRTPEGMALTDKLEVEVPEGAISFTVAGMGVNDNMYSVYEMTSPSGEEIVTPEVHGQVDPIMEMFTQPFTGQMLSPNRAVVGEGLGAILVPNTPAVALEVGTYSFRIVSADAQSGRAAREPFQVEVWLLRRAARHRGPRPPPALHRLQELDRRHRPGGRGVRPGAR